MPVYMIVEIEVLDSGLYGEYVRKVPETVGKHGGEYLARGEGIKPLAGGWEPERIIVLRFPGWSELESWLGSPEYRRLAPLREKSTRSRAVALEGV